MLTRKQKEVARAVYLGRSDDEQICTTFGISDMRLARWRAQPAFIEYIDRLCEESAREARCILSRYGPLAAMRLAELIGSEKPDVARRAALDLIDRCLKLTGDPAAAADTAETTSTEQDLTDEQARQLLLTLAEGIREQDPS